MNLCWASYLLCYAHVLWHLYTLDKDMMLGKDSDGRAMKTQTLHHGVECSPIDYTLPYLATLYLSIRLSDTSEYHFGFASWRKSVENITLIKLRVLAMSSCCFSVECSFSFSSHEQSLETWSEPFLLLLLCIILSNRWAMLAFVSVRFCCARFVWQSHYWSGISLFGLLRLLLRFCSASSSNDGP